jgi:hypothetical protein
MPPHTFKSFYNILTSLGHGVITLALGSQLRQRGLQGCKPRGSPVVTPHVPGSVGKREGMNPHTPKAIPTLGDGVSWTFEFSEGDCRGQNSMT